MDKEGVAYTYTVEYYALYEIMQFGEHGWNSKISF